MDYRNALTEYEEIRQEMNEQMDQCIEDDWNDFLKNRKMRNDAAIVIQRWWKKYFAKLIISRSIGDCFSEDEENEKAYLDLPYKWTNPKNGKLVFVLPEK